MRVLRGKGVVGLVEGGFFTLSKKIETSLPGIMAGSRLCLEVIFLVCQSTTQLTKFRMSELVTATLVVHSAPDSIDV